LKVFSRAVTSWAAAGVANADARAVPVISRDHIMVLYIICFIRYLLIST
jgi:hypothetical protein